MDRKEWLKSLKIGDKIVDKEYLGYYKIFTIKNITQKKRIRLKENNILLDEDGIYTSSGWNPTRIYIEPYNKEIKEKIQERIKKIQLTKKFKKYIENTNLDVNILEQLIAVFEKKINKKKKSYLLNMTFFYLY